MNAWFGVDAVPVGDGEVMRFLLPLLPGLLALSALRLLSSRFASGKFSTYQSTFQSTLFAIFAQCFSRRS